MDKGYLYMNILNNIYSNTVKTLDKLRVTNRALYIIMKNESSYQDLQT